MIFRFTPDIGLRYFQCKVVNTILFLNKQLFKMKIVDDEKCSFCKRELQDIVLFFCECEFTKQIWNKTSQWIYECKRLEIEFTKEKIIFGFEEKRNDALNCIVTLIKKQMFLEKLNDKTPVFGIMKKMIIQYYEDERYICNISGAEVADAAVFVCIERSVFVKTKSHLLYYMIYLYVILI